MSGVVPDSIPAVSSYCRMGEDINSFTPVQHPANDMTTDIVTTHFDYHSIDHNLLKLDILGHDDPTMIRMLQDLTGIDPTKIPLDDKEVMSLFQNTSALGITAGGYWRLSSWVLWESRSLVQILLCRCFLIPSRRCFSDLVRISGLGPWYRRMAGQCPDTDSEEVQATISHCHLYP